jgi:hypothetical protein
MVSASGTSSIRQRFRRQHIDFIPPSLVGLYRLYGYVNGRLELLRVGEGRVRSRLRSHLRSGIPFDYADVEECPKVVAQEREREVLARYRNESGRLPCHNPIAR